MPQALRPDPTVGVLTRLETTASSNYHALQISVARDFHAFTFHATYTWSKFIDDVSSLPKTNIGIERSALPLNENNLRLDRAVSDFDIRHALAFSALWDVPMFKKNRWLGGWKFASIATLQSGRLFTLYSGGNNLAGVTNNRLNDVAGALLRDSAAFAAVRIANENARAALIPAVNQFGTLGRNTERGDSFLAWNFSVSKDFPLVREAKFQLRAEIFNAFNITNFEQYDAVIISPNFGQALSAYDPRRAQIMGRITF